jgi:hypothetical protein
MTDSEDVKRPNTPKTHEERIARASALNHELAEYAKAYENASDDATMDAIEKHIDRLTDEYAREVFGLSEEEIARVNAEAEGDVARQIASEIDDFISALRRSTAN